jgi:hypothetical protein
MSRPSFLGDFDVVTGPPAPIRRIAPAIPPAAPDPQQPSPARDNPGPPTGGKAEPSAP